MNFKKLLQKSWEKVKSIWISGRIQRSSRITYDVFWNVILFFIVVGFIGLFFGVGIGAGYFAALVKDEPIRSFESMEKDIYNYEETSKLYFANDIYIGDVRSDLHREEISLDNISKTLTQAVIATEDEYFNEHKGVVPKAIVRAVVQEVTNSNMKSGGSTLTQQIIKNQILTNEVSFDRKAKEILLALRLERFFNKDEILEAYLNIIPYGRDSAGRNIAGIQTASQGVFGVDAKDLNLPQAAYLAGLPQSPSAYTPYALGGELKSEKGLQPGINRMKTVLKRMLDAEYISEKDYKKAIAYDIVADFNEQSNSPNEVYPYLTVEIEEEAKEIIMVKLAQEDGYSMEDLENNEDLAEQYRLLAKRSLSMDGYHIHSTINKEIYDAMQQIVKEYPYYGPDRVVTDSITGKAVIDEETGEPIIESVQTGAYMVENHTGKIISFVGGREFVRGKSELNHATNGIRSPGSTIKPLLDYAPALEKGVVQPGSPVADYERTFQLPGVKPWSPRNYESNSFYGIVPAREALANSYNVSAAAIYMNIIHDNPGAQYLDKMGLHSLSIDYGNPSLSIGAMTYGITNEQLTNAFATFGNNGQFYEGYMIEKITTNDGQIIYEHEPDPVDVYTPQTTYLTIDMMRDVIRNGTATFLNTQLNNNGVDWAGKTGTSQKHHDAWFVATNPNITFGVWIGYPTPYDLKKSCQGCSLSHTQRIVKLWAELINSAADIDPDLVTPQERFTKPDGIVSRSYCSISGMLPSELCTKAGLVKSDLFNVKFVPTEVDDSLITGSYVTVDGKAVLAGPKTPSEFVKGDGLTFNPEFIKRNGYDELKDLTQLFPRKNRELWEKIGVPSGDIGNMITDDGKNPTPPTSLANAGTKLTWNKSASKDVVGYRIYRAAKPGDAFSLVGSTIEMEYNVSKTPAVYYVVAVDYFGLVSDASKEITIGDFKPSDDEQVDKKKDDDEVNIPVDDSDDEDDAGE